MTPDAIRHLSQDPVLAAIIEQTPAPQPAFTEWANDLYLALLESIVSQQISVKAADAIFRRFRALFADNYPHAEQLLLLTTEEMRGAGLSGQKADYLRSVATFTSEHSLERSYIDTMTDEEIVQYLLPIRGVGRWTVEMLLLFVLDRPDVFPIDDLVIRQRMVRAYPAQTTGLAGRALYKVLHRLPIRGNPIAARPVAICGNGSPMLRISRSDVPHGNVDFRFDADQHLNTIRANNHPLWNESKCLDIKISILTGATFLKSGVYLIRQLRNFTTQRHDSNRL